MKYLKTISLIISIICFVEVYYMYNILSFIDYPYLYVGLLLLALSIYLFIKKRK
ncbi:MAG: LPXTG cell wall anchor domain-containing protein [Flavobacteriales bacterium]|nr:MAG: LPXTG cell wall anchor domain-containing protein [Flavobacteriales bacterium TMED96]RPG56671.1 MAG: LPXTG cell wall anchor domain-containing protein [Flavobacteriales bacterium TMED96]RZP10416.1 MAG: LPXTG cell wall anchor domain-containing protein [Flavobacteriales bacterium]